MWQWSWVSLYWFHKNFWKCIFKWWQLYVVVWKFPFFLWSALYISIPHLYLLQFWRFENKFISIFPVKFFNVMVSKNVPKGAQIRNLPCGVKREKLSHCFRLIFQNQQIYNSKFTHLTLQCTFFIMLQTKSLWCQLSVSVQRPEVFGSLVFFFFGSWWRWCLSLNF